MFGKLGAPEILLILLVVILIFGAKKLPETARGLGRSLRIFKAETKGLRDDDRDDDHRADGGTTTNTTANAAPPAPRQIPASSADVVSPPRVNQPDRAENRTEH